MSIRQSLEWMVSNDTGISSKTIVAVMEGIPIKYRGYPNDPDDLGRCIRLLNKIPEYRQRLDEMRKESLVWNILIEHWNELERLYREEEPTAPKCYQLMRNLIDKI